MIFSDPSSGKFIVPVELREWIEVGAKCYDFIFFLVPSETKGNYLLRRVCFLGKEKATLIFTQLQTIKIEENAVKINSDIRRQQHF